MQNAREEARIHRELALQRGMDSQLDGVIQAAGRCAKKLRDDRQMTPDQIQQVLNVSLSTHSVEVVTNYVRFQIGQSEGSRSWRHNSFGEWIIYDVEDREGAVLNAVDHAIKMAQRISGINDLQSHRHDVHLKMIRLYLGYLYRCFVFGYTTQKWDNLVYASDKKRSRRRKKGEGDA